MLVVDDPRHLRDLERQPKMDQESWDTALPVCGELLFKQQPVVDIDRDNENAIENC